VSLRPRGGEGNEKGPGTKMAFEGYLWIAIPLAVLALIVLGAVGVRRMQAFNLEVLLERAMPARVLAEGVPATAVVRASTDAEIRVERIYILTRLTLDIQANGPVPAFEAEVLAPISPVKLPDFATGRRIRVKVDPATRRVAIDQALK